MIPSVRYFPGSATPSSCTLTRPVSAASLVNLCVREMSAARMTPEVLLKSCVDNEGYETPSLNDQLYLHFKGFRRIENLEEYTDLKALWLESNGIEKLENLDHLSKLRCLYVQQNLIQRIENMQNLVR